MWLVVPMVAGVVVIVVNAVVVVVVVVVVVTRVGHIVGRASLFKAFFSCINHSASD